MRKKNKLVYGVGINDADYTVQVKETVGHTEIGTKIQKLLWFCPFYVKWKDMLRRCYSQKYHDKFPTYVGCRTVPEWHYFMTFRAWMEKQDWEGRHLDKDLLIPGNKVYSPDTCVFLDPNINTFLIESTKATGNLPIGVTFHRASGKFVAQGNSLETGKRKHLGLLVDPQDAHQTWLSSKLEEAKLLASSQKDERVSKALLNYYEKHQV